MDVENKNENKWINWGKEKKGIKQGREKEVQAVDEDKKNERTKKRKKMKSRG